MKSTLVQNQDLELMLPVCCPSVFNMTRIFVFQFIAALLTTLGTMTSYGKNPPISLYAQCAYIALSMFWVFVISGQLSGGQGNPIITLSLLFTNGSNVTLLNSIVYFVSQYAGAIVGGAIGYATISVFSTPESNTTLPITFGGQLLGAFMFIVFYLMIMSASTRFVSNFWSYLTVPLSYYICCMLTKQYQGINPAAILANQIFYGVYTQTYDSLQQYWAYICGPVVGALVASVFFNFFLLPLHRRLNSKKQ